MAAAGRGVWRWGGGLSHFTQLWQQLVRETANANQITYFFRQDSRHKTYLRVGRQGRNVRHQQAHLPSLTAYTKGRRGDALPIRLCMPWSTACERRTRASVGVFTAKRAQTWLQKRELQVEQGSRTWYY